jgi:enoyl-CoA hydratase/carnithine racemase
VAKHVKLGLPEVRLAVTPSTGGTQRLPRIVGIARAKELVLTGRIVDAAEAERIGLVNEVVAGGRAVPRAREIGEEIAERGPLAVRAVKELVDKAFDQTLAQGHDAEIETSVRIFQTDDLLEGARSFVEKRTPDYHGR